jgi:hypothetical protein
MYRELSKKQESSTTDVVDATHWEIFNRKLSFRLKEAKIDLKTKLSSHNFSQKTNEPICFSILTTRNLNFDFKFQVFTNGKTNSFVRVLGEVTARQFLGSTDL